MIHGHTFAHMVLHLEGATHESVPNNDSTVRPLVGINYFAGWWQGIGDKWYDNTGTDWRALYPERVPLLGQYNRQATMDAEIIAASDAGVDFFQILWYDDYPTEREPNAHLLNRGVTQFMASPESHRMSFYIEWCNTWPHFSVHNESEWETMIHRDWLPAMAHPSYLRVGGALVFKVINAGSFLKDGCNMNHTLAEERWSIFRIAARAAGLGELLIGAGVAPDDFTDPSWWAGAQYNWTGMYCAVDHDDPSYEGRVLPWANESTYVHSNRIQHAKVNGVPFLPLVVSGWDPRPWHEKRASFDFPTPVEWENELHLVQTQLQPSSGLNLGFPLPGGKLQPAFNIYAWNEFGEGGIMAPSVGWNASRLKAITKVFGLPG